MKLEVGMKIGIYKALVNVGYWVTKGNNYLGQKPINEPNLDGVEILDNDNDIEGMFYMENQEVRKVGSLIVKEVKNE